MLALPFPGDEPERFILYNRAANRAAVLIIRKRVLRLIGSVEEVARAQRVIAEVLEGAAVKLVGAGLGDDVDRRAGAAAKLGLRTAGDRNLGQRIDRKDRDGTAPHAGLVDRRQVAIAVVHVGAVEQVVVGAAAIAVQAEQSIGTRRFRRTHRIACRPRNQFEQLGKVTSVDRQLSHFGGGNRAARGVGSGFHQRHVGVDLNRFLHLAGGQSGVSARWRAHAYRDLVQRGSPESLFFNGDAVGAQRQFGGLIFALVIRGHSA